MSLFKNQNFVTQLAQHYGIEEELDVKVSALAQALVENETRKLLENSVKFMRAGKREELLIQDIESALKYMGVRDICLIPTEDKFDRLESGSLRQDRFCSDIVSFMKEQLKGINHLFRKPEIKAHWIYLNGKVPQTNENIHIRNFSEIKELKTKELQEQSKKFNVIRGQPLSLLASEEEEFVRSLTSDLERGVVPTIPQSNLNNVFFILMGYLTSTPMSDHAMVSFLLILKNPYIHLMIEHYLNPIVVYLATYEGIYSWQVGLKLSQIILKWREKYRNITQAIMFKSDSYSQKIKKLAFQVMAQVPLDIEVDNLEQDVLNGVFMAEHFLHLIHKCSRRFRYQSPYHNHLSEGLVGIEPDEYVTLQL